MRRSLRRSVRRRAGRRTQAPVPDAEIFGFGGPELRRAGGELIGDFTRFSVTGLVESLRVIPRSVLMLRRLIAAARAAARRIRSDRFPDFNFRLMAGVRRLGIPIVYYVSPQLWAWRPGRMKTMQASVDRVLVIFPFEERIYKDAGVDVRFVGHPLVDAAKAGQSRAEFLAAHGLAPDAPTIALLPGSRRNEVEHTAPVFADAMPLIRARVPGAQFTVACAATIADAQFAPLSSAGSAGARSDGRRDRVRGRGDHGVRHGDGAVRCTSGRWSSIGFRR